MPPATRRIMPARTMSLWLTISASAGASFSVPIKKREAFIQIFQKRRLRRDRPKGENGGETDTDPASRRHGRAAYPAKVWPGIRLRPGKRPAHTRQNPGKTGPIAAPK